MYTGVGYIKCQPCVDIPNGGAQCHVTHFWGPNITGIGKGRYFKYRVAQKWHNFCYALTLQNIDRYAKLFHSQNQEEICNNTITKDPTTPQLCYYTTL